MLDAELLIVGIPRRGLMLATNAKQSQEAVSHFAGYVSLEYHRGESAQITPLVFAMQKG